MSIGQVQAQIERLGNNNNRTVRELEAIMSALGVVPPPSPDEGNVKQSADNVFGEMIRVCDRIAAEQEEAHRLLALINRVLLGEQVQRPVGGSAGMVESAYNG